MIAFPAWFLPLLTVLAFAVMAATWVAHRLLPYFTLGQARVLLVRTVLLALGTALGLLATQAVQRPVAVALAFLFGFGLVHVPAAGVLLLKRARGEERS